MPTATAHRHFRQRGATTADGAMLLADDVLALDLDADSVIVSACNSKRGNTYAIPIVARHYPD
jgi:hypothetical protein